MKIVGIKRDAIFSPNSVEKDRMILQQVLDGFGDSIKMIDEKMLSSEENADVYISMARHSTTLELLKEKEKEGALIINSAYSVERCERGWLNEAMRIEGLPIPDSEGKEGYWLKRGDMSAQSRHISQAISSNSMVFVVVSSVIIIRMMMEYLSLEMKN